jgi:cytidine deaminase
MNQISDELVSLKAQAKTASASAYAPYSKFRVGSVVTDQRGRVFSGCNMENASYGLTQCAERNAIAAAVVAGSRELVHILIYTPGDEVHAPCGACRQVIGEMLRGTAKVISCCDSDEVKQWSPVDLLPHPFQKEVLLGK